MGELIRCLRNHLNDDLIRWKLVRAFGSFNDRNVIKIVMEIEQNNRRLIIRNEAKRSIKMIEEGKKLE